MSARVIRIPKTTDLDRIIFTRYLGLPFPKPVKGKGMYLEFPSDMSDELEAFTTLLDMLCLRYTLKDAAE